MIKSDFMFSNPKLTKLNFFVNNGYNNESKNNVPTNLAISPFVNKLNNQEAIVELKIEIGEKSESYPFFLSLTIGAKFKSSDKIDEKDFDKFLNVNASALLLSYARPIVSSTTCQAGMKAVNLPFINFTK